MEIGGNRPDDPASEMFPPPGGPSDPWPLQPVAVAPQKRGGLATAGIAASLALATAALVVGGFALTRHSSPASAADRTSTSATDTAAADKALCTAAAPILAESDRVTNAYFGLGDPGTPARDAALPKFSTDTLDWAKRAQEVLDAHPDAQVLLRRSLQRFVDDFQLLAVGLRPGPLKPYNTELWYDSNSAYHGPISVCEKLGVKW